MNILFWDSAKNGTCNVGLNKKKREALIKFNNDIMPIYRRKKLRKVGARLRKQYFMGLRLQKMIDDIKNNTNNVPRGTK